MATGRLDAQCGTASSSISTCTVLINISYKSGPIFQETTGLAFFFIDVSKKHHQRNSPPDTVAGIPRQFLREEEEKSITQAVTVASRLPEENIRCSSLSLSA